MQPVLIFAGEHTKTKATEASLQDLDLEPKWRWTRPSPTAPLPRGCRGVVVIRGGGNGALYRRARNMAQGSRIPWVHVNEGADVAPVLRAVGLADPLEAPDTTATQDEVFQAAVEYLAAEQSRHPPGQGPTRDQVHGAMCRAFGPNVTPLSGSAHQRAYRESKALLNPDSDAYRLEWAQLLVLDRPEDKNNVLADRLMEFLSGEDPDLDVATARVLVDKARRHLMRLWKNSTNEPPAVRAELQRSKIEWLQRQADNWKAKGLPFMTYRKIGALSKALFGSAVPSQDIKPIRDKFMEDSVPSTTPYPDNLAKRFPLPRVRREVGEGRQVYNFLEGKPATKMLSDWMDQVVRQAASAGGVPAPSQAIQTALVKLKGKPLRFHTVALRANQEHSERPLMVRDVAFAYQALMGVSTDMSSIRAVAYVLGYELAEADRKEAARKGAATKAQGDDGPGDPPPEPRPDPVEGELRMLREQVEALSAALSTRLGPLSARLGEVPGVVAAEGAKTRSALTSRMVDLLTPETDAEQGDAPDVLSMLRESIEQNDRILNWTGRMDVRMTELEEQNQAILAAASSTLETTTRLLEVIEAAKASREAQKPPAGQGTTISEILAAGHEVRIAPVEKA